MKIHFAKYHGAGNDFILIDCRHSPPQFDLSLFARTLCERRKGIGADGLLLLLSSTIADYRMRIFNADGSEPSMCGNGIRCLFDFIQRRENISSEITIETLHGLLKCKRINGKIAVNLGAPTIVHWPIELPQGSVFVINTGVPHAVLFVDALDKVNVVEEGAKIRFHPRFAPTGVNVNFVSITTEAQVVLRTYERGVEAETLACGTGAAAAAFVAMKQRALPSPISVMTRLSFEKDPIEYRQDLCFQFCKGHQDGMQIEMLGRAQEVFTGTIESIDNTLEMQRRHPLGFQSRESGPRF
jgi:diaminopimelate epimerase